MGERIPSDRLGSAVYVLLRRAMLMTDIIVCVGDAGWVDINDDEVNGEWTVVFGRKYVSEFKPVYIC